MVMSETSTILIVDDEPSGREILAALLRGERYQLAFARNGAEALDQAATLNPDLILLDVMMPGMDGFEVCRRIRATPELAEVPLIMVTALDDRDSRLKGIEAGADDFITKPFDRRELLARVRTITRLNRYQRLSTEREQAAASAQRQVEHLAALRSIDTAIRSSLDLNLTLNIILDQLTAMLRVDATAVLLRRPQSQTLEYAAVQGIRRSALPQAGLLFGAGCAGYVALGRRTLRLPTADAPDAPTEHPLQDEGFAGYYGLPLLVKGQVEGVLEIFHRTPLDPDQEWQDFLQSLAGQAATAIDHAMLFDSMQRAHTELSLAYDTTLEGWARALELRDKETEGHAQRVTEMTVALARMLGLSEAELVHIRRGALLHDIGKMGIPDSILLKPGPLTDDEWQVMRQHPRYAYDMLAPIAYLRPALDIPYCHHERWDGSGYPRGMKGEQIPLAARIFTVVDVWDALRFDRPYSKAWPEDKALAHIRAGAGTHFDPQMVAAFERLQLAEARPVRLAVLVVDDEAPIVEMLRRALGDLYTVCVADSGEQALELLEREEIAVIVTDQRMPGLTGVQLLERAKHVSPATLGILSSGHFDSVVLSDALNLGSVRGFIPKPCNIAELRWRVNEVTQQYRAPSGSQKRAAPYYHKERP
jgi:response regulator RpfG family c-di-GMP phosphodiesterase